jgi:hypothetical protein
MPDAKSKPCGGCGATDDSQRCLGCLHDFGATEPPAAAAPAWDGVPKNPERSGAHEVEVATGERWVVLWFPATLRAWNYYVTPNGGAVPQADAAKWWRYLGPCLTPSEIAAREAAASWRPIETAPKNATNVLLRYPAQGWNKPQVIVAHWAHGGGEDQPAFGPGWFRAVLGNKGEILMFADAPPNPDAWMPLPEVADA